MEDNMILNNCKCGGNVIHAGKGACGNVDAILYFVLCKRCGRSMTRNNRVDLINDWNNDNIKKE